METREWKIVGPWAVFLFYLAIALEVVVMVTPFTVYFYSIYAPVLNWLESNPLTAWLTAFFLPHISYTGDPVLTALAYLGPILFAGGLVIFFVCAYQVYSAKLLKRGVVSGGFYAWIRHPQYLGLGIAGLGLLLYWPRFIILVLYLSMLVVYYLLALNEESRMERKFGDAYRNYKSQISMFVPGEPGGKIFAWVTGGAERDGLSLAAVYVLVLATGIGLAFGLRAYSKAQIPTVTESGVVAVSLSALPKSGVQDLLRASLESAQVKELMAKCHDRPDHALVAYLVPQEYMMAHLIADLGEHEAHHGKAGEQGTLAVMKHLGEMYGLKPLRQLRDGAVSRERRIIFAEALASDGESVSSRRALDVDVLRYPLFIAELSGTKVTLAMEVPRRHAWGNIPVPAF
jgi:protein-S-isoprenylcysteine O-methyltransferase Ste14